MKWMWEEPHLTQRSCEGFVRAVQSSPELGADAPSQFGGAQTLYCVLCDLPLPLWSDGGRVDEGYSVDDLRGNGVKKTSASSALEWLMAPWFSGRISETQTCLICSQTNLVTEDPE